MKQRTQFKSRKNKRASSVLVNLHLKINNCVTCVLLLAHTVFYDCPQLYKTCFTNPDTRRSIYVHISDGFGWASLVNLVRLSLSWKFRKPKRYLSLKKGEFNVVRCNPIWCLCLTLMSQQIGSLFSSPKSKYSLYSLFFLPAQRIQHLNE